MIPLFPLGYKTSPFFGEVFLCRRVSLCLSLFVLVFGIASRYVFIAQGHTGLFIIINRKSHFSILNCLSRKGFSFDIASKETKGLVQFILHPTSAFHSSQPTRLNRPVKPHSTAGPGQLNRPTQNNLKYVTTLFMFDSCSDITMLINILSYQSINTCFNRNPYYPLVRHCVSLCHIN